MGGGFYWRWASIGGNTVFKTHQRWDLCSWSRGYFQNHFTCKCKCKDNTFQLCNACSTNSGHCWSMETKEWRVKDSLFRNKKITTSCMICAVLHDNQGVQDGGAALANNITRHKVSAAIRYNYEFRLTALKLFFVFPFLRGINSPFPFSNRYDLPHFPYI